MKKSMFSGFTRSCRDLGVPAAVEYAKLLGFEGVEPYPGVGFETTRDAEALGKLLQDAGLCAPCVSKAVNLNGPAGDDAVSDLKALADMTAAVGSPLLHHTLASGLRSAPVGAPSFESAFDDVVRRVREVADYCAQLGLRVIYEDQGFLFNGVERFDRFLNAVDRDNIGVCADLGNIFFVGETPEHFIGAFSERVFHVHIKDYLYKPGSAPFPGRSWLRTRDGGYLRDTIPGHGVVDMVSCLYILRKAGYEGFYSFEFGGPEPYDAGIREAIGNLEYYETLAEHAVQNGR